MQEQKQKYFFETIGYCSPCANNLNKNCFFLLILINQFTNPNTFYIFNFSYFRQHIQNTYTRHVFKVWNISLEQLIFCSFFFKQKAISCLIFTESTNKFKNYETKIQIHTFRSIVSSTLTFIP